MLFNGGVGPVISIPGYIVWNLIVILKTPFAIVIIRLGSFVTKRYANRITDVKPVTRM